MYAAFIHHPFLPDLYCIAIDGLPNELRSQLVTLANKDAQFEGKASFTLSVLAISFPSFFLAEARKALFKKRNLYLRAEEKGLDATLRATLLRKTEKEHAKLMAIIDEKLEMESKLAMLIGNNLIRLERDLVGKLGMSLENPYAGVFADIPDVDPNALNRHALSATRTSPKKRQTLQDEPIDPNEPVYCYCRQVSHGDMIACDNPNVIIAHTSPTFVMCM